MKKANRFEAEAEISLRNQVYKVILRFNTQYNRYLLFSGSQDEGVQPFAPSVMGGGATSLFSRFLGGSTHNS